MNVFKVLDKYPTIMSKNKIEKNFVIILLFILFAIIMYTVFNINSVSIFSNSLRFCLFLIIFGISLWQINKMPQVIEVKISDEYLIIGNTKLAIHEIYGFDIVNLDDYLEIVIVTTRITNQFEYFYIQSDNKDIPLLTQSLIEISEYVQDLNSKDYLHKVLRRFNIK
jgi:hypothetical protein